MSTTIFESTIEKVRREKAQALKRQEEKKRQEAEKKALRLQKLEKKLGLASKAFLHLLEKNPDFKGFLDREFQGARTIEIDFFRYGLPVFWDKDTCIAISRFYEEEIAQVAAQMNKPAPAPEPMKIEVVTRKSLGPSPNDFRHEPQIEWEQAISSELDSIIATPERIMKLVALIYV